MEISSELASSEGGRPRLVTIVFSNSCRSVSSSAGFDPVFRVLSGKLSSQFCGRFGDVSLGSPKPDPIMAAIFVACIGEMVHRHFLRPIVCLSYETKYSVTVHVVSDLEKSACLTNVHRSGGFARLGLSA